MSVGDPRDRPRFRFGELSPDDFEQLIFRLAWANDRRVVRLRAPDGGLDTVLPDEARSGRASHGWQAKRHTRAIDWADCEQSLDRAVKQWETRGVTFAFPRDLTGTEHATFHDRLTGRHENVAVDYWGASTLYALLDSPEGERVAASFFVEHDAVAVAERLLRAGGALQSGEDFVAAEGSIAEGLAMANPDYDWVVHRGSTEAAANPALTPGAVMRLTIERDAVVIYADLVPRHSSPPTRPGLSLRLDDSAEGQRARDWLTQLMQSGGRLALRDGAMVTVSDVPAPFGDLLETPFEGEVILRAIRTPVEYYARVTAGPVDDRTGFDVDLLPAEAPEDWDAELTGRFGGLTLTLRFRWFVERGRGEARITFKYRASSAPHDIEATALRWLLAAHDEGSIVIEDRTGERPSMEQATPAADVPPWLEVWAPLHADLAELERAAGRAAPRVPSEVAWGHVEAIATVAMLLRARRQRLEIREVSVTFTAGADVPRQGAIIADFALGQTMVANVFGTEMPVARQNMTLPPMIVSRRLATPEGGSEVRFVPLGSDVAEVIAELVPLAEIDASP